MKVFIPDRVENLVRADNTCPRCVGPKATGLVLCWPCHHKEKRHNDGGYSDQTEMLILMRGGYLERRGRRQW